jgi:type III HopA1-like effector protein
VVGDLVGDKTAGEMRAAVSPRQLKAVENGLIRDEYKKLIAEKKRDLKQAGQTVSDQEVKAILRQQYPGDSLRETLRGRMRSEFSDQDVQRMALGKRVYKDGYHAEVESKPANITQGEYAVDLDMAKGPRVGRSRWDSPDGRTRISEDRSWHHRVSRNGGEVGLDSKQLKSGKDMRRFYFNVKPDGAASLTDYLNSKLNAATNNGKRIRWQYKVAKDVKSFDRPDSAVVYVDKADYQTVKQIVMDYANSHPEAFADGTPAFTKPLARGVAAAEEPLQQGMPKNRGRQHSFGSSRSDIIAEAILNAPPGATRDEILALVRERMKAYKLDPDRPWLSGPSDVDDL